MKNLIIGVVGDESLHRHWKSDEYDLFLVYYGDEINKYKRDSNYYATYKGTKFNIVGDLYDDHKEIIDQYKYIFIPDDDLYISSYDL